MKEGNRPRPCREGVGYAGPTGAGFPRDLPWSRARGLAPGRLCPQRTLGHVWGHLWLSHWGCSWHQVGGGQGGCSTPHRAQDGPQERMIGPSANSMGGGVPTQERESEKTPLILSQPGADAMVL